MCVVLRCVQTSWGGTPRVIVLKSTFWYDSIQGRTKKIPRRDRCVRHGYALLFIQPIIICYREPLKGSSQVVRMWVEKIAFSCLQQVNKTQLFHPISQNPGKAF